MIFGGIFRAGKRTFEWTLIPENPRCDARLHDDSSDIHEESPNWRAFGDILASVDRTVTGFPAVPSFDC